MYLRDDVTAGAGGDFWSPSWQPTRRELAGRLHLPARDGLYRHRRRVSRHRGEHACDFVPLGENLEVWQLTVTNHRAEPAQISAFSAIEFCLWDAQDDATNFQRNFSTGQVEVDAAAGVIYHKTEYREAPRSLRLLRLLRAGVTGFDTADATPFLGPYRGWDDPAAVARRRSRSTRIAHGWQPIGSHHVKLTLQPGESRQIIFLLGYHENPADAKFDPPGSQTINKQTVQADHRKIPGRDGSGRGIRRPVRVLGADARHPPGGHALTSTPTGWSTSGTRTSA